MAERENRRSTVLERESEEGELSREMGKLD